MRKFTSRAAVAPAIAVLAIAALSGVAAAGISGGEYSPKEMDCSPGAEAYDRPDAEPGCHTVKINVESGSTRYAEVGVDQMATSGTFPKKFCAAANTNGTGGGMGNNCGEGNTSHGTGARVRGNLSNKRVTEDVEQNFPHRPGTIASVMANGVDFYFGADDNLDAGEHDGADGRTDTGTDGVQNGPSDGGAIAFYVHPQDAAQTPTAYNPVPVAGASFGSCADGICEDVATYRHTVYQGDGKGSRNVADYKGKKWDPFECSGASLKQERACDAGPGQPRNLREWKATEGETHADPGVQIYEDPDAQGSPIDPIAEIKSGLGQDDGTTPLYPLPGLYLGTCGLVLNGERQGSDLCA